MKTVHHSYNDGIKFINPSVIEQIDTIFYNMVIKIKKYAASKINEEVSSKLKECGWSDTVRLSDKSKISITSMKDCVGLCMQTGNVGRIYADLLKLQALYSKGTITSAIIIMPTGQTARALGGNIASLERLCRELPIFSQVITLPIMIIAF